MFTIDSNGDLVGYSVWEADDLYQPLAGCYADGRLVAITACNRAPEGSRMRGPRRHCWFRLSVEHKVRDRLVAGDPAVKVLRTEDAMPIEMVDAPEARPLRRVEDFLTSASRRRTDLTGYPAFLRAPQTHQLDILFLDFLGRLPDFGARQHYLDMMNRGTTPFTIREDLLSSEEFRNRKLTVSDRPGSLITSPIWSLLADSEPLDEIRPRVASVSLAEYQHLSDEAFVDAIHQACFGEGDAEDRKAEANELCREEGRHAAATHLIRIANENGRSVQVNA